MSTGISQAPHSITLAAAWRLIEAGLRAAQDANLAMSIAITDQAGNPKASARMDAAALLSVGVAASKAWTAAATGFPTTVVHEFISADAGALLSMPHVKNLSVVGGGLPIIDNGRCIGGLGVSGGSVADDIRIAEVALQILKG